MRVALLVLNYNGAELLAECLPSIAQAARASRHECRVAVVDNSSTDGSLDLLAREFPEVEVVVCPNRGLCSYNEVLGQIDEPVAILLNSDIKLDLACIDPLVGPLRAAIEEGRGADGGRVFLTAPLCWRFDGKTYDGQKTAVRWRMGLVQATSLFAGHEPGIFTPGLTASAGAAIAVDRRVFLELSGFDPLFLPGRLEDLDLCYRAWLAGWRCLHVPEAVAYHRGAATFGRVHRDEGCDFLALRNTLLFQWKNLRMARHRLWQRLGIPLRVVRDLAAVPFTSRPRRLLFIRAFLAARRKHSQHAVAIEASETVGAEKEFFRRFHPTAMRASPAPSMTPSISPLPAAAEEEPCVVG
ncbi:MAG: glycosyltransferase [Planctomycetia bacterium]|nr:glycosyltransferase [Planctomycetia bacterium]